MSVYVDDMAAPFGRMVMCHMIADSHEELISMADEIGVQRHWIQKPGTPGEHFDISLSKRRLAVMSGAVEITWREFGRIIRDRRIAASGAKPAASSAPPIQGPPSAGALDELSRSQIDLEPDTERILRENLWEFYE